MLEAGRQTRAIAQCGPKSAEDDENFAHQISKSVEGDEKDKDQVFSRLEVFSFYKTSDLIVDNTSFHSYSHASDVTHNYPFFWQS